ncbi:hypothetical protein BRC92_11935 [Halobacteriales archaeon QS_4_69_31]|nr:MAG: hypothetical protein BRC92_11935 [Halobacteriales archaeon QS_4_69_31]
MPGADVFASGLEWLQVPEDGEDDTEISRLLLVDDSTILVSTIRTDGGTRSEEQAVFGNGFGNGLVTIVRRLMSTGLAGTESIESD